MDSTNDLERRIQEKLALREEQRLLRQNHLRQRMNEMDVRMQRYAAIADKLMEAIIHPRMERLASSFAAINPPQWETTRHSCSLLFKHSSQFPATATLELGVTRDGEGKTVCVQYRATILPLLCPLEGNDQTSMPLEEVDESKVAAWVEAKLLQFVDTYLRLETLEHYQGENIVTDPVCGMSVNKAHAPAQIDYEGKTYFFCVEECRQKFAESPDRYLAVTVTSRRV
jgi:YHS domain-containing protein